MHQLQASMQMMFQRPNQHQQRQRPNHRVVYDFHEGEEHE